jgi:hypothetical protein
VRKTLRVLRVHIAYDAGFEQHSGSALRGMDPAALTALPCFWYDRWGQRQYCSLVNCRVLRHFGLCRALSVLGCGLQPLCGVPGYRYSTAFSIVIASHVSTCGGRYNPAGLSNYCSDLVPDHSFWYVRQLVSGQSLSILLSL